MEQSWSYEQVEVIAGTGGPSTWQVQSGADGPSWGDRLAELGRSGWELVSFVPIGDRRHLAILKKPFGPDWS